MVYWYVRDDGHGLTIHVNFMVKCVCYMGLQFNGCFMTDITLMGGHYRVYIISGVSHLRSDSVVLLVLWTVVYNGQGTDIVLQVTWDSANLVEND